LIDIFKATKSEKGVDQKQVLDWTEVVNKVFELYAKIEYYQEHIAKRQAQIGQWEPWGDFDPSDLGELGDKGVFLKLFTGRSDRHRCN